jgi:hypothetical protein
MSVADVWNVPSNEDELARWGVLHMILHRDQIRAALNKYNTILPEYVLDPVDTSPNSAWFQNHQTMHDNIDALTKVAPFNLLDVDLSKESQLIGWIQGHAQLHQQESNVLGVFS